jgi:hypothetical protein
MACDSHDGEMITVPGSGSTCAYLPNAYSAVTLSGPVGGDVEHLHSRDVDVLVWLDVATPTPASASWGSRGCRSSRGKKQGGDYTSGGLPSASHMVLSFRSMALTAANMKSSMPQYSASDRKRSRSLWYPPKLLTRMLSDRSLARYEALMASFMATGSFATKR